MVTLVEVETEGEMKLTAQVPEESVHWVGVNEPPRSEEKPTVPAGTIWPAGPASVTTTAQSVLERGRIDDGLQLTVTVTGLGGVVNVDEVEVVEDETVLVEEVVADVEVDVDVDDDVDVVVEDVEIEVDVEVVEEVLEVVDDEDMDEEVTVVEETEDVVIVTEVEVAVED